MRRLGSRSRWWAVGLAGAIAVVLGGAAFAADASVAVVDNAFEPRQVTINVDEKVTWEFEGTAPHSVTADDGSFDSHPQCSRSNIVGCSTAATPPFERTFTQAGTFAYYCKIHGAKGGGGMSGVVVVNAPGANTTAPTTAAPTTAAPTTTTTGRTGQTTTTTALATSTTTDETTSTTTTSSTSTTSTTLELGAESADDGDGGVGAGWVALGALLAAAAAGYAGFQLIQSRRATGV